MAYPRNAGDFPDFRTAFRTHVLNGFRPTVPMLSRNDGVVTQGSCFALNIHNAIKKAGIRSAHNAVFEACNTPLANRLYFDYALGGKPFISTAHAKYFPAAIGPALKTCLADASVFIFTVGLIYAPFRAGEFVFSFQDDDVIEWRQSSFMENVDHLRAIISTLKAAKPHLRIVITLSPIPIAGYFGRTSAIVADCVSKSTLRTAIDEVMRDDVDGVSYWPSFEAVRWLSGHTGQIFGTDGEDHRHPGTSFIDVIVEEFISAYFNP